MTTKSVMLSIIVLSLFSLQARAAAPMSFLKDSIDSIEKTYSAKCDLTKQGKCGVSENYCTYHVTYLCKTTGDERSFKVRAKIGRLVQGMGSNVEEHEHLRNIEISF